MMDDPEENQGDDVQEFKGFKMEEIKFVNTSTLRRNSREEIAKEEKDPLLNGTEINTKPDNVEEEEDEEEEEEEGDGKSDGGGGEEASGEKNSEISAENEMSAEEMSNKEEEDEQKSEPKNRLRSGSKEENEPEESVGGCRSSDEEDFLGFDVPDNSKEEFMKALIDEPECLDSDESSPFMKTQMRITRALKKPVNVDLSNPEFRKPFEYGWVRELVYRSTSDSTLKRNADIYYFTPKGKKVRSFREVAEHLGLNDDLSIGNFTFFKGPIGIGDPDKEIIREAKVKPPSKVGEDNLTTPLKKTTPKLKATPSALLKVTPKGGQLADVQSPKTSITPRVVFKGNTVPKNKTSLPLKSKLGVKDKKRKSAGPDDADLEDWSPEPKAKTNGVKRGTNSPVEGVSPPPEKKQKVKDTASSSEPEAQHPVIKNFMMNLSAGYIALLHAFQYLKVHELLRASCVSHMWKHLASHSSLWETVRMKNSRVRDWEGFGRALSSSGTRSLDLKKMLLPDSQEEIEEMWLELSKAVAKVKSLRKLDLGRCTPEAVEIIALACPQLESIISLTIRGMELDMKTISMCTNLTELRLKSVGGIDIKNLSLLSSLEELKHLSLTTVKSLAGIEDVLCEKLESLELGECSTLSESVATEALPKLRNLRKLRLEKGQGASCPITQLLNTVATLPNLAQLELINFDIKPGFDKALAKCTNLRTLLIIPTYVTQSATTNHVVMGGVSKLSSTLTYFVWGLTLELLRVTDLFIDQVEGQKGGGGGKAHVPTTKKGSGDSIPILKPLVEDSSEGTNKEGGGGGGGSGGGGHTASQVDILALPKLQKVLSTLLPTTKIKILKVPFSATWRQTVSDVPQ